MYLGCIGELMGFKGLVLLLMVIVVVVIVGVMVGVVGDIEEFGEKVNFRV